MIIDYDYVCADTMSDLAIKVLKFMKERRDWEPIGGPAILSLSEPDKDGYVAHDINFYQAMVKRS